MAISISDIALTGSDAATSKISISNIEITDITFDDFGNGIDLYLSSTTLSEISLNNISISGTTGPDLFACICSESDSGGNITQIRMVNISISALTLTTGSAINLTETENTTITNLNISSSVSGMILAGTDCSLSDVKIDTTTGVCINISGSYMTFNGLVLSGGLGMRFSALTNNITVNNVTINGNGTVGIGTTCIYMQEMENAIFSNISIDGDSAQDAIQLSVSLSNAEDIIFDNIDIINTINAYNFFRANDSGLFGDDHINIRITKNTFNGDDRFLYNSGSSTNGLQLRDLIVSDCRITSDSLSASESQIELETQSTSRNLKFCNNTFINSSSTASNSISIINNSGALNDIIISNNNFQITNATSAPIYLEECENVNIIGNTINSNSSTYAIESNEQVGNINVSQNSVFDGAALFYSNFSTSATRIYNIQGNFQDSETNFITTASTASTNETFKLEGNNIISTRTSGIPDLITLGSATGMNFDIGKNHFILNWAPSSGTSSTYLGYHDRVYFDSTNAGGNFTITLSDINVQSHGHIIYIELQTFGGGNTLSVNPTSPGNDLVGLANYATGVTFNASGEYAVFRWTGNEWDIIANSGGVIV